VCVVIIDCGNSDSPSIWILIWGVDIFHFFKVIKSLIYKDCVTPVIFRCHVMLRESYTVFMKNLHCLIFEVFNFCP
jgi:hypothetical protein